VIVLDASVLIAHLDGRDAHHAEASRLLAECGAESLGASTVSLAETLVAPARAGRLEDATDALERIGIADLPLSGGAPARLAELRARIGRKLPDCCVLLTAQDYGAAIASFDSALIKAAAGLDLPTLD
jgi:predicted nucleic acid-binding protein